MNYQVSHHYPPTHFGTEIVRVQNSHGRTYSVAFVSDSLTMIKADRVSLGDQIIWRNSAVKPRAMGPVARAVATVAITFRNNINQEKA